MTTSKQLNLSPVLDKLLELLKNSHAVKINGGLAIPTWKTFLFRNDPENILLHFSWNDEHGNFFSFSLTEGNISAGRFKPFNIFTCNDGLFGCSGPDQLVASEWLRTQANGNPTEIKIFTIN